MNILRRHVAVVAALGITAALFAGCSEGASDLLNFILQRSHSGDVTQNGADPRLARQAPDPALVEANTAFAFDLYRTLAADAPVGNTFISPASVSIALSMTYNGADNATRDSMAQVLGYSAMFAGGAQQREPDPAVESRLRRRTRHARAGQQPVGEDRCPLHRRFRRQERALLRRGHAARGHGRPGDARHRERVDQREDARHDPGDAEGAFTCHRAPAHQRHLLQRHVDLPVRSRSDDRLTVPSGERRRRDRADDGDGIARRRDRGQALAVSGR